MAKAILKSLRSSGGGVAQIVKYLVPHKFNLADGKGLDDYFVRKDEHNGIWLGGAAKILELDGKEMTGEDLTATLNGLDPRDELSLLDERQARADRVLAYDFTVSFDKTVSAVYAIADMETKAAITGAIERAVKDSFDEFVDAGVFSTRTKARGTQKTQTTDLLAAMFIHVTSRNQDPQLHAHLNILNFAMSQDGKFRAVSMSEAYKRQTEFALTCDLRLSNELKKLGLELPTKESKNGLVVAGVPDELVSKLSSRRKEILEALSASGLENNAHNAEIVARSSRRKKEGTDLPKLHELWADIMTGMGISSIDDIKRNAEREMLISSRTERDPLPEQMTLLQSITGGRAVAHARDISREVKRAVLRVINDSGVELTEGQIRDMIAAVTSEAIERAELTPISELAKELGLAPGKNTEEFYGSRALLNMELEIKTACARGVGHEHQAIPKKDIEKAIRAVEERKGFGLNSEQRAAAIALCSDSWISVLVGAAGAGKSTSAEAVRVAYEKAGQRVIGVAPSAQAAIELESGSGIKSSTTTKFLLAVEEGRQVLSKSDVVVVDESGMLATSELYRFYELARDVGFKLVLMGDDRQLEPIPSPCLLSEISSEIPQSVLIDIRRQKNVDLGVGVMKLFSGGCIQDEQRSEFVDFYTDKLVQRGVPLEAAAAQADSSFSRSAFDDFSGAGMIVDVGKKTMLVSAVVSDWVQNIENSVDGDWSKVGATQLSESIMLASKNQDVLHLNALARQSLKELGVLDPSQSVEVKTNVGGRVAAKEFCRGDRIMFRAADSKGQFSNGTRGSIIEIDGTVAKIALDANEAGIATDKQKIVSVDLSDYLALDHAYAMTVAKSQGMTVNNTSMLVSSTDNNRSLYVGMSRFRDSGRCFTTDTARLEHQFGDVVSKNNTVSYIESLSGRLGDDVLAKIDSRAGDGKGRVDLGTVKDAVQRIGQGIEEEKMEKIDVLSSAELSARIRAGAARFADLEQAGKVFSGINHASLVAMAKSRGFSVDQTVDSAFFMSRKTDVDGVAATDKLQATYSPDEGWFFRLDQAAGEKISGGNVDFVKAEMGLSGMDATVHISQTNADFLADFEIKRRNQQELEL